MTRRWSGLIGGLLAALGIAGAARADSPYGKTFVGSAQMCFVRVGTCTGNVNVHVYLGRGGHVFSFLQSEGGQEFSLGQFISFGTSRQRFLVKGDTLVFEDAYPYNGSHVVLHGYLKAEAGSCIMSGTATTDGHPEPITFGGSCQVYDGQR